MGAPRIQKTHELITVEHFVFRTSFFMVGLGVSKRWPVAPRFNCGPGVGGRSGCQSPPVVYLGPVPTNPSTADLQSNADTATAESMSVRVCR